MIKRIMIPCEASKCPFNKNSMNRHPLYIRSQEAMITLSEGLQGDRYYRTALSIKQAILRTRITNPIVEGNDVAKLATISPIPSHRCALR